MTPNALKPNPDAQSEVILALGTAPIELCRTVLANVRITPDITERTICIHQLTHEQRINSRVMLSLELANTTKAFGYIGSKGASPGFDILRFLGGFNFKL
jgi:hypothetical protein